MNTPPDSHPAETESLLSGAYQRILRNAIWLSLAATIATALFLSWRSGLALAVGSLIAYLNFVWLHRGAELMVQRMMVQSMASPAENAPSKLRMLFFFAGRYLVVAVLAYVILKGYPRERVGFIMGLVCPILAAMYEGFYEAVVIGRKNPASD